jgi:hypothetical protein
VNILLRFLRNARYAVVTAIVVTGTDALRQRATTTENLLFSGYSSGERRFFSGNTVLQGLPTELKRVPRPGRPGRSSEPLDVQCAIEHWYRNSWGKDCVPFLDTFDFSPMRGDWGHRFLICGGHAVEQSVFVTYGAKFAELLGLPVRAETTVPFVRQIGEPYRDMFVEGYRQARTASAPVILEGTLDMAPEFEFEAVFMPIMLEPHWSKQLILGSFDFHAADIAVVSPRRVAVG